MEKAIEVLNKSLQNARQMLADCITDIEGHKTQIFEMTIHKENWEIKIAEFEKAILVLTRGNNANG